MPLPASVRLVEVGPRDGLQNEPRTVDLAIKIELVERLAEAGLPVVETGSFVNSKWVPQMADSEAVFAGIQRRDGTRYAALTPNLQGLERALAAGASEVAVFAAASEAFSQKNINCSIADSLLRFRPVLERAADAAVPVRAYVSCIAGCPYQGDVPVADVVRVAVELHEMGCYEVSLGDTIGVGTPAQIQDIVAAVGRKVPVAQLAAHFHDTYGQALANLFAALQCGVATIDSSVAGLGGCPYARGATGNVATEDVVYMLQGLGIATGVDLDALIATGTFICNALQRDNQSRVGRARQIV